MAAQLFYGIIDRTVYSFEDVKYMNSKYLIIVILCCKLYLVC